MGFLSLRSGGLLAWGTPTAVPAERVKTEVTVVATPQRLAARRPIQHCKLYCRWCNTAILLPHERLGMTFAQPALRKLEARTIASVCSHCGHVSTLSMFRGLPGFDTRNTLVTAEPDGDTVLVDWLKCDEPTCSFALPLFVRTDEWLTGDRAKELASKWDWHELTCAAGHKVQSPLWVWDTKPYTLPDPIR